MTEEKARIGIGLLGASRIASKILPSISKAHGIDVRGVAAREVERAEVFAATHEISAYSSYSDCLQDARVDAVYISALNSSHAKWIEEALGAGKHVLCEKPLVLEKSDAERLFALAARRKLILLEGFMYRFHPQIQRMHQLIKDGRVGRVQSLNLNFSFVLETHDTKRRTVEGGGGALNDLGCYCIDFVTSLFPNASIDSVTGRAELVETDGGMMDVSVSVSARLSNGVHFTLNCAIDRTSLNLWEIQGDKGTLCIFRNDPHGSQAQSLAFIDQDSAVHNEVVRVDRDQFICEFEHFAECVRGRTIPHISPRESMQNAAFLEKIRSEIVRRS